MPRCYFGNYPSSRLHLLLAEPPNGLADSQQLWLIDEGRPALWTPRICASWLPVRRRQNSRERLFVILEFLSSWSVLSLCWPRPYDSLGHYLRNHYHRTSDGLIDFLPQRKMKYPCHSGMKLTFWNIYYFLGKRLFGLGSYFTSCKKCWQAKRI